GHLDSINAIAFPGKGKLLASASMDRTIRIWDVTTGKEVCSPIRSFSRFLAFAPNGKTLAFADQEATIRLWDVAAGKQVRSLSLGTSTHVPAGVFTPDGKMLAVVRGYGFDSEIVVLDLSTGRELSRWAGQQKPPPSSPFRKDRSPLLANRRWVDSIALSPDGKTLASAERHSDRQGGWQSEIKLWDMATGKKVLSESVPEDNFWCVCFSPDGRFLAFSGRETTSLWELAGTKRPRPVWKREGCDRIAFAPRGRLLAWSARQAVHILDT